MVGSQARWVLSVMMAYLQHNRIVSLAMSMNLHRGILRIKLCHSICSFLVGGNPLCSRIPENGIRDELSDVEIL